MLKQKVTSLKKIALYSSIYVYSVLDSTTVFAGGLPTIDIPSGSSDDYILTAKNIIWALFSLIALMLCAVQFFSTIGAFTSKFAEFKQNKASLGDVIGTALLGIGLLLLSVFLLTQLTTALDIEF